MSKRKRESSSPKRPTPSTFVNQATPGAHKLNLALNPFSIYAGRITKSNSTNTLIHGSASASAGAAMDVDVDMPFWKPKPPKQSTPFSIHKQVHPSTSTSSIESSLSLIQSSNASSVENLSLTSASFPNDMSTPNNSFKFVKPLQIAFNSSGLLSKKKNKSMSASSSQQFLQSPMVFNQSGILIERKSGASFPDTPCKSLNSLGSDIHSHSGMSSVNSDSNLMGYLKKTARQLLSEFKNNKGQNIHQFEVGDFDDIDSYQEDSLRRFSSRLNKAKNAKNISISINTNQSPLKFDNQSPLSKQMYDDFQLPVMTKFNHRNNKKKNVAVDQLPYSTNVISPEKSAVILKAPNTILPASVISARKADTALTITSKAQAKVGSSKDLKLIASGNGLHGSKFASLRTPTTPVFTDPEMLSGSNAYLAKRFNGHIKLLGKGEFSKVYRVEYQAKPYAFKQLVRKAKNAICFANYTSKNHILNTQLNQDPISQHLGIQNAEKIAVNEEVEVLNSIKMFQHDNQTHDNAKYVIDYVDFFLHEGNDYIITDFYENGSLDQFLLSHGLGRGLDEFRIWKILLELLKGLSFLHDNGILHLDLKPANIFISNDGHLKIGDFGLSALTANSDDSEYRLQKFDREGDRGYIAPEILANSKYDKPADIFSLGLIIVEIAANIYLPDNGISWQKLRNGDLSDAGNLSTLVDTSSDSIDTHINTNFVNDGKTLDLLVHWMIEPEFANRPSVHQLLNLFELTYIEFIRKKPATIHEPEYDMSEQSGERHNDFNDIMIEESVYDLEHQCQSVNDLYSLHKYHA